MVYRVYVSKKTGFNNEDKSIFQDLKNTLGITTLQKVKIYNRYDVSDISKKDFDTAVTSVFSEPVVDDVFFTIPEDENTFAVQLLPGQFDQRADSAQQCIQFITAKNLPTVRYAKIYKLFGNLSINDIEKIKAYLINPVESRLASMDMPKSLDFLYEEPKKTPIIKEFNSLKDSEIDEFIADYSLAMDKDDLLFCQNYFKNTEKRNPTLTELKVIDTYWSDHCRHTTFFTNLSKIDIQDENIKKSFEKYLNIKNELYPNGRSDTLMGMATIGAKYLKKIGKLKNLDESEEINACSVKIDVTADNKKEKWLLMFKNETHNHPTEIEPFGGAATCLGGAIRDPLSGRSFVYQAMRVTGAADPTEPLYMSLKGKLSQRKICQTAAAGYSSYGNQIGLATGHVSEFYHPSYKAKRLELGAVVGAAPIKNVVRKEPSLGDVIVLLGGKTGRDGCGGATGSSKAHDISSLEECGAEVQKGNAPEERKIQRLFKNQVVTKMIKRCNDFGAGGVCVAIGELCDSLSINLDAVPKKYEGLTATEIAISESQERMAVVIDAKNLKKFIKLAKEENLLATKVADVTDSGYLEMYSNGDKVVNLSREFLNTSGAQKFANAKILKSLPTPRLLNEIDVYTRFDNIIKDLNVASQIGLIQRFDSTVGAGTVLMPLGGKTQMTPAQAMVAKINSEEKEISTASIMSYGFDPYLAQENPYYSAYYAVVSSVAKLVAVGGDIKKTYLSFQEYFERLRKDDIRWGKPVSALLGALEAQLAFNIGAIGGKDSMSGSFENLDVVPTLVSFACGTQEVENIISPELKKSGSNLYLVTPLKDENGLYNKESLLKTYKQVQKAIMDKRVLSCWAVGFGGIAEGVSKMAFGNDIGVKLSNKITPDELFEKNYGAFIIETDSILRFGKKIGETIEKPAIIYNRKNIKLDKLKNTWTLPLEEVYPTKSIMQKPKKLETISYTADTTKLSPKIKTTKPKVLIPVFPGTNSEYDLAKAFKRQGAETEIFVVKNLTSDDIKSSARNLSKKLKEANILAIPGGFSGGDEPDGSAKFIISMLQNPLIADEITALLEKRDGLALGICNGFQALVKLGLVPYGKITSPNKDMPTLTFNTISRHQSGIVRTRVSSVKSPWLMHHNVGDNAMGALSHGEGRFIASEEMLKTMITNGQIATQYVDFNNEATSDIKFNLNDSMLAIEGITSPDGRVFGKMLHSERYENGTFKNIQNPLPLKIFKGAVDYFTK